MIFFVMLLRPPIPTPADTLLPYTTLSRSLAAAQISPGIDDNPSAREKVEREGEAAMDRLKGAVSRRKAQQQNGPSDLPKPSEVERRRAFEAMRARAKSPAMEARARDALETGQDRFAAARAAMAKRLGQALGPAAPETTAAPEAERQND